jgi:hypothetical protein
MKKSRVPANLSTGQIFYSRGKLPIFVIARKDAVLTKQSRNRQIPWIASTPLRSRNDGIENLSGVKMANLKNGLFAKSVLYNKYKLRDLWVRDPEFPLCGSQDDDLKDFSQ